MFGKCYVLSDAAPCLFSEANVGELSDKSGRCYYTRPIFVVVAATGRWKNHSECRPGLVLQSEGGFCRNFSVSASISFLKGYDVGIDEMCKSSAAHWWKSCVNTLHGSADRDAYSMEVTPTSGIVLLPCWIQKNMECIIFVRNFWSPITVTKYNWRAEK